MFAEKILAELELEYKYLESSINESFHREVRIERITRSIDLLTSLIADLKGKDNPTDLKNYKKAGELLWDYLKLQEKYYE